MTTLRDEEIQTLGTDGSPSRLSAYTVVRPRPRARAACSGVSRIGGTTSGDGLGFAGVRAVVVMYTDARSEPASAHRRLRRRRIRTRFGMACMYRQELQRTHCHLR